EDEGEPEGLRQPVEEHLAPEREDGAGHDADGEEPFAGDGAGKTGASVFHIRPSIREAAECGAPARSNVSAAASSIPSRICQPRARTGALRGSPRRPAIGRAGCRPRRTPSAPK